MKKENIQDMEKWYSEDVGEILSKLQVTPEEGLFEEDAKIRLSEFGANVLPQAKRKSALVRFISHFNDILVYVLIVAAIVTAVFGYYIDTAVILLVAFVNASIGFFQESKAERAIENIKKMLSPKAQVIREGVRLEIDASTLTIGDIVILSPGDKVPADLRLIRAENLKIEESALTGESLPTNKKPDMLSTDTMLGDRKNMAFSSTSVRSGKGLGVVVAVGQDTEIGKINQLLSEVEKATTPLIRQTAQFGKFVSTVIIVVSVFIFAFGYFFRDYEKADLLLSVIGLAIAAIPEGLTAILSIILAIGVQTMAKKNAIVRSLPSVETLGSVSVICSDKTGTLTKNEMTVQTVQTREQVFEVTGTGYSPEGAITIDGKTPVNFRENVVMDTLINCFNVCNDSALGKDKDRHWNVKGDPTEGALITLYQKAVLIEHKNFPRISTVPFDSEYKYMATLIEWENDKNIILIKGAPDRLMSIADKELTQKGEQPFDKQFWEDKINELANKGQRIIGAAYKLVPRTVKEIHHEDIYNEANSEGIVFLGLAGMIDPPREEAIEAIEVCAKAGITVKMITGDHVETAKTIGRQMGIENSDKALQGKDLDHMTEEEFVSAANEYNIFARTSPEHKLRIVHALQSKGKICAMTGDGVNDAPALKQADVGVAMGIKGTDVTKDAAEIVLADDNFATIVSAVKEGRRVYDNLKKSILFILPTNGAESFLIMASIIFSTVKPLTPVQILWVNMITSVTISLALAFEKAEPGVMNRPPRSPKTPLLDAYFIWRICFLSVFIGGGSLFMNVVLLGYGVSEQLVRTVTLQTIVLAQAFHLFNSRNIRGFAFNKDFFGNKYVFIVCFVMMFLQLSVTYIPFMNSTFGTVPLALGDWKYPFIFGIIVFIVVEIEKAVMRQIDKIKAAK
ncbi:Cation transport ATPase [Elusimicrobium minutum Pei191]|uniref:Cation transport ATPase n=1 Tax=Elusimicrobium minutum (strain Pei191) TaxID=445932 RepID=B2KCC4_ELUMP|nr:cation-transporting P-type ATPase [Elusimicrobium minutum]ACC98045.1 Cation transport ATPase [Elusimicrobium minutum Pei191]